VEQVDQVAKLMTDWRIPRAIAVAVVDLSFEEQIPMGAARARLDAMRGRKVGAYSAPAEPYGVEFHAWAPEDDHPVGVRSAPPEPTTQTAGPDRPRSASSPSKFAWAWVGFTALAVGLFVTIVNHESVSTDSNGNLVADSGHTALAVLVAVVWIAGSIWLAIKFARARRASRLPR